MSVKELKAMPWAVWRRQVGAILRLEWRKSFFAKRAWWIWFLAFGPVLLCMIHASHPGNRGSIGEDSMVFAGMFQFFYLKLGIYFGCVGIFGNLFRGELLEKTLHYYLLAPVRREVLMASKYLAGMLASVVIFGASVALAFYFISAHFGAQYREYILHGPGLSQVGWYLLATTLACVGYGAVFMLLGMLFRNPMIPAAVVMVWEAANGFLPSLLKKFSVIFYLKSLCPVEVPYPGVLQLIAMDAQPAPAWLAIPGLLAVSAAVLVWAGLRARTLEVSYSE